MNCMKGGIVMGNPYDVGTCPNIRSKSNGFLKGSTFTCSATGEILDKEYAYQVCYRYSAHASCSTYRRYGVCNSKR